MNEILLENFMGLETPQYQFLITSNRLFLNQSATATDSHQSDLQPKYIHLVLLCERYHKTTFI